MNHYMTLIDSEKYATFSCIHCLFALHDFLLFRCGSIEFGTTVQLFQWTIYVQFLYDDQRQ